MYSLRSSSQIPVHTRDEYAYDQLLALIGSGDLQAGARLPGEQTMAERFGVSRPMLRQALARLRAEGKIIRARAQATTSAPGNLRPRSCRMRRWEAFPT